MATQSIEDYIKAIFKLGRDGDPVQTSAIAESLELRPASVSNMIRRLANLGLLVHEPYRGVVLTAEGETLAKRMLRRHRLLERFLTQILDYPWDEVHDEAERLEHAVSQRFVDALDRLLESPSTDPHGAPIPSPDGTMEDKSYPSLAELAPGDTAVVRRVPDSDAELLRYFGEVGIYPDAQIEIVDLGDHGDPITLRVSDRECHVGRSVAAGVYVERL